MDRNTVLQDLHTYHNPTTQTNQTVSYPNTPLPQQQQQQATLNNRMFDTQPDFLDGIDFTHFDSRLFTPPPLPQQQPQQQPQLLLNQHQQLQQQHQQYMNATYQSNHNANTMNMYPQHNILLQRYNSNGSTASSSNSQPSYLPNYSPMAHYTASLQHQQDSLYYSQQQQQQHLQHLQQQLMNNNNNTKKRKNENQNELLIEKKKPKMKKKKTKIIDPNAPPKPKRKTGLNKPLILSPALSELMDGDKELSRPELVQKLWKYIKLNNLQDPSDRRFILCDDQLKKIFNQDRINSFGMNKDLSAHLTKKEEPQELSQSEEKQQDDLN